MYVTSSRSWHLSQPRLDPNELKRSFLKILFLSKLLRFDAPRRPASSCLTWALQLQNGKALGANVATEVKLASILNYVLQSRTLLSSPALLSSQKQLCQDNLTESMGKVGRSSCSTFLTSAGKDEVKLTRVWTWLSILLPDGKINYQRETLKECPRTLGMYEIAECQTPEFLFSFQLHVALRKCSRSHNGTSVHTHTSHFPVLVGANTKPRAGIFLFPFVSFALSKWPRGLPGSAASGRGARAAGTRQPSGNGGELSSAAPGRQCQRPRRAPGGRPIGAARPPGALCRPLSRGRAEPPGGPTRPASASPRGTRRPGPCSARAGALPGRAGTPPERGPGSPPSAQSRRLCSPGPGRGAPTTRGAPHRASPGAPQLTGTGRAAGHYSIAGSAPAPRRRRRSRLSRRGAGCGGERRAWGARRAARAQSARPRRPGEAREASAAQEGAGDHVPGGGGRGAARGSHDPARRRRARAQEIQTLRQEIGILTKHSRPAAAARRGARASLNPRAAGARRGGPRTGGGAPRRPPRSPSRPSSPCREVEAAGSVRPDKTLALGVAFSGDPDAGKGLGLSLPPSCGGVNLQPPSRFPYLQ